MIPCRLPLTFGFSFAVLPLAFCLGCNNDSSRGAAGAPSSSASSAVAAVAASNGSAVASASAAIRHRPPMRHHTGLAGALLRPAYDLPLSDAQRTAFEKLEEPSLDGGLPEVGGSTVARRAYTTDLVAGIRATKLDTAKLQADYANLDKAMATDVTHEAEELDGLHGILDATQRQTLVDQVKARRASHASPAATAPDGGAVDLHKKRLDRLTVELTLDDAQKKQVAALIAKEPMTAAQMQARRDAWQKRQDALLDAFAKDPFDAKKLDLAPGGAKSPHESEEMQATFIGSLLPILHPDQREKLAVRTERSGNRVGRMGMSDENEPSMPFGMEDDGPPSPRMR